MLKQTVEKFVDAAFDNTALARTETFESKTGVDVSPARGALVSLLTLFVMLALLLFVGKYLWNEVLVALVPAVKPAKSVWQILGLSVLLMLISPGCAC